MTLADKIRSMTDEELAEFIANLMSSVRHTIVQHLAKKGLSITIVDMPYMIRAAILENLKKPVEED